MGNDPYFPLYYNRPSISGRVYIYDRGYFSCVLFGVRKIPYHGDMGHLVETCWKLIGYPPGHPKARSNKSKNEGNHNRNFAANQVSDGLTTNDIKSVVPGVSEAQLQQLISILSVSVKGGGTDSSVFYVTNLLLITWIKWIRKPICLFNVCFYVNRKNMLKMFICTKKYILEVLAHFDNYMESQPRLFIITITRVVSSMWITDTVRRFRKNVFESRQILSANHHY